jgi:intergrase/recombinase
MQVFFQKSQKKLPREEFPEQFKNCVKWARVIGSQVYVSNSALVFGEIQSDQSYAGLNEAKELRLLSLHKG